jgi:hypothetical protein
MTRGVVLNQIVHHQPNHYSDMMNKRQPRQHLAIAAIRQVTLYRRYAPD